MPSITPAQIVAIVQPVLATLVAFGVPMTDAQTTAILGLSTSISLMLVLADALIRRARAQNIGAIMQAQYVESQDAPPPPPAIG